MDLEGLKKLDSILNAIPRYTKKSCDELTLMIYEGDYLDYVDVLKTDTINLDWLEQLVYGLVVVSSVPSDCTMTNKEFILMIAEILVHLRNELVVENDDNSNIITTFKNLLDESMELYKIRNHHFSSRYSDEYIIYLTDRVHEELSTFDYITIVGWNPNMSLIVIDA